MVDFCPLFTRTLQSMFGKWLGMTVRTRLEIVYMSEPSRRRIESCAAWKTEWSSCRFPQGLVGDSLTRGARPCSARLWDDGQVSGHKQPLKIRVRMTA